MNSHVLMLNAHYSALRVTSVRRAIALLFKRTRNDQPVAEIVHVEDNQFISYNFEDWCELSVLRKEFEPAEFDWIRTVRFDVAVPRIVRVLTYNKVPRQPVKLNRRNIFARDGSRCQYCGKKFPTNELSLDHIIPRSQDGPNTWENIVCACIKCNVRKGGRTPARANMKLISKPVRPKSCPVLSIKLSDHKYRSWQHFLDQAYWDVELK